MLEIEIKSVKKLLVDFLEVLEKEFTAEDYKQVDKKEFLENAKDSIYGLPVGLTSVGFNDSTAALGFLINILNGLLMTFPASCCFISTKVSEIDFTKMMVLHSADIVNRSGISGVIDEYDASCVERTDEYTCLDVTKIQEVSKYLFETDFYFVNYSFSSINDLCDFIKKCVKENKTEIFFIHHLEDTENLEVIDNLAKELNIAIVASCTK
ncbi:MAG: hypothetical protein SPK18_07995 [Treponema sp.]|nr:hypothetical protein [Spirochaetia bacterium]MDD7533525.1 hypothetical protein [Treponema sp.]MDY3722701.1 hypothetical protein [Treponema sp.]MDY5758505.1 hypothetical protein [Treponema sp.]MDY5819264.1 hypothetical protein [Treponema sp.]